MYQLNPLFIVFESRRKLFLNLSKRYTPEERKRIVNRLIEIGKKNGGLYNADEYGKLMLNGQERRIENIARKNFHNLRIDKVDQVGKAHTRMGKHFAIVSIPKDDAELLRSPISKNRIIPRSEYQDLGYDKRYVKKMRKFNDRFVNDNVSKPLNSANIAAHEADEYSLASKNMKRLNKTAEELDDLVDKQHKRTPSKHNFGVIKREYKRQNFLNMLYGKGKTQQIPRSKSEYKAGIYDFTSST